MSTVFYLSTCDTCKRILKEVRIPESFAMQDIKKSPITEDQLEAMYAFTNSYEDLFNKRAQLYRKRGLNQQELSEDDYKNLLLEHYTFLKRPVILDENQIFVGNAKKTVEALKEAYGAQ